ncbi:MAG: putative hydroxymethylpyrimidine transporter CytX [Deltaproteobacteria bacterium]|nr:putative hydroxymethylpyrimidine transporter CytX [Deltaproteobacteria bacterium]
MSTERNFSTFSHMVLWFGASISIAEIITGTLLAPLGFKLGVLAIVLGHVIGASVLFLAGLIGASSGLSATASFRISFGRYGSYGFSVLNMLQLLGWTAVMIMSGSKTLDGISRVVAGYQNERLWCLVIGGLILIWISRGLKAIFRVHTFVVMALFLCFMVLAFNIFTAPAPAGGVDTGSFAAISFGEAVEFSVAMCLSWLPLISDYSRTLKKPISGTALGVACYFCGGVIMFTVGLGAALFAGTPEISDMLLAAGLGVAGLFIVAFSTVTNTFLDAHSAGVSAANINPRVNERRVGVCVVVLATIVALCVPMSQYENFLYLIGSVFAPLFAILLVDFFVFKRRDIGRSLNVKNLALWAIGFVIYRALMSYSIVLGMTFPVMLIIGLLCFAVNKAIALKARRQGARRICLENEPGK